MKPVYIKKTTEKFDAIVVGSGITGGWAVKELCQNGLKTLMIERGRLVEHRKDYIGEGIQPWHLRNRGQVNQKLIKEEYPIQSQCYAFNDATKHFFAKDIDQPYSTPDDQPFSWIRGNQLGGRSLLWHRQSYRWSDLDFTANVTDGHGVDWPIRYKDLAPWYSYVERYIGVSGAKENIPHLPDSEFQPPFEFNTVELAAKKSIEEKYPDRKLIMGRCAHLTAPTQQQLDQGRIQCQARNECQKGCSFGAFFSTQSSTLPEALQTNNLSIAIDTIVHSVIYDKKSNRAIGVRVIDSETKETYEYFAKVIFLCASTLGTTQIMLNSTCENFPNGIANSSGVLGHYLMDHLLSAGAYGRIEGFEDSYYYGRRPTSPYMPRFRNIKEKHPSFVRGYALGGGAAREAWNTFAYHEGFGVDFKKSIQSGGDWYFQFSGSGEMLPRFENSVILHPSKRDKWGIPLLHIQASHSENENNMREDMANSSAEILEAIGAKDIVQFNSSITDWPVGLSIHEMGTARMGRDPKSSILNAYNQTHDIPNLFVTDGACMTSGANQNPSLTYMALTARACDYAIKQLKMGKL